MSLFKAREWWAVNLNENEMYDSQCLLTLTLEKDENQSILIGSHGGYLRLFSPSSEIVEEFMPRYKPSHLMLETQLSSPILQIKEGSLISGTQDKQVAVLHPRLFSVYSLKKKESKETQVGDQVVMELSYQHLLRRSSHSFVLGPFGGVRGRHFICIQSLDGFLSFYEQESFAFQLYLPNFMLPFHFVYLEKTDFFLFLNGCLTFECYSYEALASAENATDKKIPKIWEYNLGEGITDVQTIPKDGSVVIVLSERSLLGLNDSGKMIFMKRLEYKPLAMLAYMTEENKKLMIAIATESQFLNLYEGTNLKWSMKIDRMPVAVNRIFLKDLPGGIVLLSEDGFLQCVFIGTHPSVYPVPPLVQPEPDLQKAEKELRQLQKKIGDNDSVDLLTADMISLDLRIDKTLKIENGVRMCRLMTEVNVECHASKLQVMFAVEPPLVVSDPTSTMAVCCEKTTIESYAYLNRPGFVSSLDVEVIVSYITREGMARCIRKNGVLPLALVVEETTPAKEARHKVTVAINKPICGVNILFGEFTTDTSPNAIGLKFLNSQDTVTIVAAKSSQRYRLQADVFPAASLLLTSLVERLRIQYRKNTDFVMTYSTPLPLENYFEGIYHHHEVIKKVKDLEEKMAKEAAQYMTIQKKVLSRLKDRTPKPFSTLQVILKDTFQMILSSVEEMERVEDELFLSRCSLSSLNRMMVTLMELTTVRTEDLKLLKMAFNPHLHDADDQGWLEVQEATTSYLLRTGLAKSERDQQKPSEILLEPMTDTSKLVKHISSVIDRVTKGIHLLERNEFGSKKEAVTTKTEFHDPQENKFDDVIPPGSKFVTLTAIKSVINVTETAGEKICQTKPETLKHDDCQPEMKNMDDDGDEDDDGDAIWDVKIQEMRI